MIPTDLTLFTRKNRETDITEAMIGWDKKSDEKAENWAKQEHWDYNLHKKVIHDFEKTTIPNTEFDKFRIVRLSHDTKKMWFSIQPDGKDWTIDVSADLIHRLIITNGVSAGGYCEGNFIWVVQKNISLMDTQSQVYQDMQALLNQKGFREFFPMTALIPGNVYFVNAGDSVGHLFLGTVNHLTKVYKSGKNQFRVAKSYAFIQVRMDLHDEEKAREALIKYLRDEDGFYISFISSNKSLRAVGFSISPDLSPEEILLASKKRKIIDGFKYAERDVPDYSNITYKNSWGQHTYGTKKVGNEWLDGSHEGIIMSTGLPIRVPASVKPALDSLESRYIGSWSSSIKNNIIVTSDIEL